MTKHASFFGVILLGLSLTGSPALASTTPVSGDLIKASGSAVYYFGADSKRYVFPSEKTFFSWYADFSSVKTISDADLATYPLGGNVTYRPGVRLVKITTDPKVYAVAAGGTLRWIETEAAAQALYGTDWAKKVDDLSDAFFINYRTGAPIAAITDFTPTQQTNAATTINVDKNIGVIVPPILPPVTPPTTTTTTSTPPVAPTYMTTITASDPNPLMGQTIHLLVEAAPTTQLSQIKIYFDGILRNGCSQSPCTVDVTLPTNGVKSSFEIRSEADWYTSQHATASSTVAISSDQNKAITVTVARPEVIPGSNRDIWVDVDQSFSVKIMNLYVDDNIVQGCDNLQHCRYAGAETSATGTAHSTYAIAADTNGNQIKSPTKTFTVVDNEHPIATIVVAKTQIYRGETVDVTVQATDDGNVDYTEIWQNSTLLKHCTGSSCTISAGPWSQAQSVRFTGKAVDTTGLTGYATSTYVAVQ